MNKTHDRVFAIWDKFKKYEPVLREAKTPFFLLEEDDQEKHLQQLEECCNGKAEVFQVYKTNPVKRLCEMGAAHGFGAEVVSEKELRLALNLCSKVLLTGLDKSENELRLALENKNKVTIIIDNIDEVERIARLAKGQKIRVGLRVSIKGFYERFGLNENEIKEVLNYSSLDVVGLHAHSGISQNIEYYRKLLEKMRSIIISNKDKLPHLKFVDIGGAYPIGGYKPFSRKDSLIAISTKYLAWLDKFLMPKPSDFDYADMTAFLNGVFEEYRKIILSLKFTQPKLYIEPGRLYSSQHTYFVARVMQIKHGGIILDGGYTNLPPIAREKHIVINISSAAKPYRFNKTNVYGPLPHGADFLSRYYYGDKLKKGDLVMICDVGAYYYSMASNFIRDKAHYYSLSKKKFYRID